MLWFAFILVSLNHWKQFLGKKQFWILVVICFHFSIFEPLETVPTNNMPLWHMLWFAFILVSLNHWKQSFFMCSTWFSVVICFHFSIFEPLETVILGQTMTTKELWFAFILVSLNHWKQFYPMARRRFDSCDLLSF